MATTPFALSVHHFISSVGADVGFASIIGLAILVLLYFAQARETANLREQAYEAAQRVSQLEARLTTLATRQQQAAGAAQPAVAARAGNQATAVPGRTVPAPAPAMVGAAATAPGPPAGVAAPALAAATKLIPTDPVGSEPVAADVAERPLELTSFSGPAPVTAAASNGVGKDGVATGRSPSRASQQSQRQGGATQPPRTRPASQPPRGSGRPRSRAGRRFALLIGALAVAGVVVAVVQITSSGGKSQTATSRSAAGNTPQTTPHFKAAKVNPATVTVTVLNGTATSGLADRIATRLTGGGFKQGTVTNASDQTRTATVVAYMPGHRRDALAVASSLKLGPSSVQPVDSSTRAVACPASSSCTAQVVVTVGTDLAA
jgi:LytR cell envelope-related transcriptional attenuator